MPVITVNPAVMSPHSPQLYADYNVLSMSWDWQNRLVYRVLFHVPDLFDPNGSALSVVDISTMTETNQRTFRSIVGDANLPPSNDIWGVATATANVVYAQGQWPVAKVVAFAKDAYSVIATYGTFAATFGGNNTIGLATQASSMRVVTIPADTHGAHRDLLALVFSNSGMMLLDGTTLDYVWGAKYVTGTTLTTDYLTPLFTNPSNFGATNAVVGGAQKTGYGEVWFLSSGTFSNSSAGDIRISRIRVSSDASYPGGGATASIGVEHATLVDLHPADVFLSGELASVPGMELIRAEYDWTYDALILIVKSASVGTTRVISLSSAGAIRWNVKTTFGAIGPSSGQSRLTGTTFGWVSGSSGTANAWVIDTGTGEILQDYNLQNVPNFHDVEFYDSSGEIFINESFIGSGAQFVRYSLVDIPATPPVQPPPPPFPVWTLFPDWKNGVTERLEWVTDVLTSQTGQEQRRAVRPWPRRISEADFTLIGDERRLYESFMRGPAAGIWLVPLWWEQIELTALAAAGSSALSADFSWMELFDADYIILWRDAFHYEVTSIADGEDRIVGVNLRSPLFYTWPAGTRVSVLRAAILIGSQQGNRRADDAYQVKLQFVSRAASRFPSFMPAPAIDGVGWWQILPNEAEDMTTEYQRMLVEYDNKTSYIGRVDTAGVPFRIQQFAYTVDGRFVNFVVRAVLFYLKGKFNSIWFSTNFQDMELTPLAEYAPGDTEIAIVRSGYTEFAGANVLGGQRLGVFYKNGFMTSYPIASSLLTGEFEVITLGEPLAYPLTEANVSRLSFMQKVRGDSDVVELLHHTDTRGPTTYMFTFRTVDLDDTRVTADYNLETWTGSSVEDTLPPAVPTGQPPASTTADTSATIGDLSGATTQTDGVTGAVPIDTSGFGGVQ